MPRSISITKTHLIQIDEETGGDAVWDALHAYAATHPAPACLLVYVDPAACWPAASSVTADDARSAERWLAACATACGWDDRTTPLLVIPTTTTTITITKDEPK